VQKAEPDAPLKIAIDSSTPRSLIAAFRVSARVNYDDDLGRSLESITRVVSLTEISRVTPRLHDSKSMDRLPERCSGGLTAPTPSSIGLCLKCPAATT
jgi:hypothetical protein